jgi:LemA protein
MGRLGLVGCLIVLLIVVLIFGGWYIGTRNKLVSLDEGVNAQWGQVQNDYQRRYDLIPNLVNTVKGYAAHERETFEAVTNARARVGQVAVPSGPPGAATDITSNPQALAQYEQAQAGLGNALSRLLVVMERYPELKANQNFLELQSQLEGTENRIAVERKRYNDAARDYNVATRQFPGSIVASMSGFKQKAYFAVTNPAANQAPAVDFGTTPATTTATTTTGTAPR